MAVDAAPTLFPSTLLTELTPGDTIIDETSAWMTRHTGGQGMEMRLGSFLMDPRRNGKAFVATEIMPNSTGAGAANQWQFGLRFFRYDLSTRSVDYVSYIKDIVQASVSVNDWRGPGIATADGVTIWAMYYEGTADPDDGPQSADELYVAKSTDSGLTWSGETQIVNLGVNERFGGHNFQRPQIAINTNGDGFLLYAVWDALNSTGAYRVQSLSTSSGTWGNTTTLLSLASGVSTQGLLVHSLEIADDGTALAILWNGESGGDNLYAHYYYDGSSWSNLGNSSAGGSGGATRTLVSILRNNGGQDDHSAHWISLFATSTGGTFTQLIDSSGMSIKTATNISSSSASINGADGDSLSAVLDPDDTLFVFVGAGSSNSSRVFMVSYDYESMTIGEVTDNATTQTDVLNFWNASAGDDGWFEDLANGMGASAKYPQRFYQTVYPFTYDTNVHVIVGARRYDGTPGTTNYMSFFETRAESIAAFEPPEGVALETGEGGYLWIQSRADSQDSIIEDSAIVVQDIATEVELHPIYGPSRFFLNRWLRFVLRYTNWGDGDLSVTYFGDNRPEKQAALTLNPAGFPTPFSGPSRSGEFLMPPNDYQAIKTVSLRAGGSRLTIKLSTVRGRYSLRGLRLVFQPTKIQVSSRVLPYNTPVDGHVGSQG